MRKLSFDGKVEDGKFTAWDSEGFREAFHSLNGSAVRVSIENGNKRSNPQNSYYWGVVVETIYKAFMERGDTFTREDIHAWIKEKWLAKKMIQIVNPKTGEIETTMIPGSTTDLTTVSMSEDFIEPIQIWAAEFLGVVIPDPDQRDFL